MNLSMKNNETLELTFDYGNVARNPSKNNPGEFYYAFSVNGGDRLNCDAYCLMAIRNEWPGRNGSVQITKLNNTRYDCVATDVQPKIYALELTEWDEGEGKYVVTGAWPAESGGKPTGEAGPSKSDRPAPAGAPQAPGPTGPSHAPTGSWEDVTALYAHTIELSRQVWQSFDWHDIAGDECGAVERMAVSMAIEAKKMGLKAPSPQEKFLEQMEEEERDPRAAVAAPQFTGDEPPQGEPPPEDDDGLPY